MGGILGDFVANAKSSATDVYNNASGSLASTGDKLSSGFATVGKSVDQTIQLMRKRAAQRDWWGMATAGLETILGQGSLAAQAYEGTANKYAPARRLSTMGPAPEAAPAPPLPVMPTIDSEAVALARKRQAAGMLNRGGRSSTILTGNAGTLGS